MIRHRFRVVAWVLSGAILLSCGSGCKQHGGILGVDRCADIQPGAIPEPAGTKICNWQAAQTANAYTDQVTLYRSDFVGDSTVLAPAARDRISRQLLHAESPATQGPWIVEPSGDKALDAARLEAVSHFLAERGVAALDVVLGTPPAIGLAYPFSEQAAQGLGQRGTGRQRSGANALGGQRSSANALGGQRIGNVGGGY